MSRWQNDPAPGPFRSGRSATSPGGPVDLEGHDYERRALGAEFKRLHAEQKQLKTRDDLDAWRRHIAALVAFQSHVEQWKARDEAVHRRRSLKAGIRHEKPGRARA